MCGNLHGKCQTLIPGASILCEPAQSKCTWTCHNGHFAEICRESAKRPGYHLDRTPDPNTYRKNPSVWPHCLGNMIYIYIYIDVGSYRWRGGERAKVHKFFQEKHVVIYGELPSAVEVWRCFVDGEDDEGASIYLTYLYLTVLLSLSLALPTCLLLAPLDFPRHMMDLGLWSENSGGQPKSRLDRVFICLC